MPKSLDFHYICVAYFLKWQLIDLILFQVDLNRNFNFHNSKVTHKGLPIIASNMDTVGTFEMAAALAKVNTIFM